MVISDSRSCCVRVRDAHPEFALDAGVEMNLLTVEAFGKFLIDIQPITAMDYKRHPSTPAAGGKNNNIGFRRSLDELAEKPESHLPCASMALT